MNKSKRGITLIALVITIIVLLILAGISISMLAGDNGILKNATRAKDLTRAREIQETVNLEITNNEGTKYIGGTTKSREQVISELHNDGKLTDEEVEKLEENDVITIGDVTIDFSGLGSVFSNKTLVELFRNAERDNCTNSDGKCTRADHLHIGDYVNYTNPTNGEYTVPSGVLGEDFSQKYVVSKTINQLNWRVLGIEGNGSNSFIKLIASSPMKQSNEDGSEATGADRYLGVYGAKAYMNSVTQLNKICELYKTNLAQEARSVTINDIDKLTGIASDNTEIYKSNIKNYNLDAFNGNSNYGDSYSFLNHYTPESWLSSKKITVSGQVDAYFYTVNGKDDEEAPFVNMQNQRVYNMLFDDLEEKGFYMANVAGYSGSSRVRYGIGYVDNYYAGVTEVGFEYIFGSNGDEEGTGEAVRPVICLKPEITNEVCPKIEDKVELKWDS